MKFYAVLILLVGLIVLAESCRRCHVGVDLDRTCRRRRICGRRRCDGARCRKCSKDHQRRNPCGGCNRLWYTRRGNRDVTKRCEFVCPDPKICYPGVNVVPNCTERIACRGGCNRFPRAKCCPKHCGKCTAEYYFNGKLVKC